MRVSTSKSEAMVVRKWWIALSDWGESSFKNFGVLFMSDWKMEKKTDRGFSAASSVLWVLLWTVVVKR